MNDAMMLAVADAIEAEPERFNMGTWLKADDRNLCGTVGCVAGTAYALDQGLYGHYGANMWEEIEWPDDWPIAGADILGLGYEEAEHLFTSLNWWQRVLLYLDLATEDDFIDLVECECEVDDCHLDGWGMHRITPKQAAEVLRALVKGTIDIPMFVEEGD